MEIKLLILPLVLCLAPLALRAQVSFNVDGHQVQFHSFGAQGFAYSNNNNFLTMDTTSGSFAFTDGGVNVSTALSDKLRVGAQVYVRKIGNLGAGHVTLDWASADYRFKDWFGVRGGKVKTTMGLYTDVQDMEFLHTFALLPQSVYPLDLRGGTIAHTGGDIYGSIPVKRWGSLNYTAYYGLQPVDKTGGYYLNNADSGTPISKYSETLAGGDIRWSNGLPGLTFGFSYLKQDETTDGHVMLPFGLVPYHLPTKDEHITAYYYDYAPGKWHFSGEGRRHYGLLSLKMMGQSSDLYVSDKEWFVTVAYRINKRVEVGAYESRYASDFVKSGVGNTNPAMQHITDHTLAVRFDLKRYWNLKVEGHFMNGYGDPYSARGFYLRDNPAGLQPATNMLVVRTGFNF